MVGADAVLVRLGLLCRERYAVAPQRRFRQHQGNPYPEPSPALNVEDRSKLLANPRRFMTALGIMAAGGFQHLLELLRGQRPSPALNGG
jgi:hypothetical protein